mmetsp:Transcript_20771/g.46133  ORF Transcript_20771/g.46133 Transcript_20771/m.46133 type:complete len:87 (-) Transcript_20771:44-304(-)
MGPSVNREWGTLHFRVQFGSSPNFLSISISESSLAVLFLKQVATCGSAEASIRQRDGTTYYISYCRGLILSMNLVHNQFYLDSYIL